MRGLIIECLTPAGSPNDTVLITAVPNPKLTRHKLVIKVILKQMTPSSGGFCVLIIFHFLHA